MYTLVGGKVIFDVPLENVYINLEFLEMTSPPPTYTLNIYVGKHRFQGSFPNNPRKQISQKQFSFSSRI